MKTFVLILFYLLLILLLRASEDVNVVDLNVNVTTTTSKILSTFQATEVAQKTKYHGKWCSMSNGGVSKIVGNSVSRRVAQRLIGGYMSYTGPPVPRTVPPHKQFLNFEQYNRTYYYGEKAYNQTNERFEKTLQMCAYHIDEDDDIFSFTDEETGEPITEIVYSCSISSNCCDGLDCCVAEILPWYGVLILLFIILTLITAFLFASGRCLNKRSNVKIEDTRWEYSEGGHGRRPSLSMSESYFSTKPREKLSFE